MKLTNEIWSYIDTHIHLHRHTHTHFCSSKDHYYRHCRVYQTSGAPLTRFGSTIPTFDIDYLAITPCIATLVCVAKNNSLLYTGHAGGQEEYHIINTTVVLHCVFVVIYIHIIIYFVVKFSKIVGLRMMLGQYRQIKSSNV